MEDPARPPPKGKGALWGSITDTRYHEPMIEAQVSVIGKKIAASSDVDGHYRLELPPGTYTLRFFYEQHQPQRVDHVRVTAGRVSRLDVQLEPDETLEEETVVETEADMAAIEGQILARRRAPAAGDSVGRAEIAKTPDRNAAQSAQRVVGATIVGNRFVYVRGLGERYTNAQLNGTPLPSPEPDANAVPLDLFPSLVLDSLTITKTFTPDSPGDFAGGSVHIETRAIPGKFVFSPSVGIGYNTESTFRKGLTYDGGGTDWLGFDDGTRALPGGIPKYKLTRNARRPDGALLTDADLEGYGEKINTSMSAHRAFTPPNYGANLVIGDGKDLGEGRAIGYLAALSYSRSYTIRHEVYREYRFSGTRLARNVDFDLETGNDAVAAGAFASLTYAFARGQRLTLIGMRSQLADDTARTTDGDQPVGEVAVRHVTRLSFVSRELTYGQLRGEHEIKPLNRATVEWNASIARAGRAEPNTRDSVWEYDPTGSSTLFHYAGNNISAGRHLYADQSETAYGAGLDFTQPLLDTPRETKLKFGGLLNLHDREFSARRFNFEYATAPQLVPPILCSTPGFSESCSDALFQNANIGPVIRLNDSTLPTDAYDATLNIHAVYFMGDISLTEKLRAVAGERVEVTHQTIDPFDQFNSGANVKGADLQSTDLLPSLGLIYDLTKDIKVRTSLTRTLARPQLRELAPYAYDDVVGGKTYSGNPNLKLTKITNGDLRFEYFPTLREVLAVSLFAKHFVDPIEPIIIQTGGTNTLTFENSPSADLFGVELEARKTLGFMDASLRDFSLISNLTLAHSAITIRQTATNFITNTSRALTNQAPYVLNLALDYSSGSGLNARLLYNVVGPRVVEVGTGGLDDSYAQPLHRVDAAVSQDLNEHFNLKLTAQNLLNQPVLVTVGKESREDNIVRKYKEGLSFGLSAQYTY